MLTSAQHMLGDDAGCRDPGPDHSDDLNKSDPQPALSTDFGPLGYQLISRRSDREFLSSTGVETIAADSPSHSLAAGSPARNYRRPLQSSSLLDVLQETSRRKELHVSR